MYVSWYIPRRVNDGKFIWGYGLLARWPTHDSNETFLLRFFIFADCPKQIECHAYLKHSSVEVFKYGRGKDISVSYSNSTIKWEERPLKNSLSNQRNLLRTRTSNGYWRPKLFMVTISLRPLLSRKGIGWASPTRSISISNFPRSRMLIGRDSVSSPKSSLANSRYPSIRIAAFGTSNNSHRKKRKRISMPCTNGLWVFVASM